LSRGGEIVGAWRAERKEGGGEEMGGMFRGVGSRDHFERPALRGGDYV